MENMEKNLFTKHELAKEIVAKCKGETDKRLTVVDVKKMLELLPEVIVDMLAQNKIVRIQGLLDFVPQIVEARECKNPATGEKIMVEKTKLVKLKKSRAFADRVKATFEA